MTLTKRIPFKVFLFAVLFPLVAYLQIVPGKAQQHQDLDRASLPVIQDKTKYFQQGEVGTKQIESDKEALAVINYVYALNKLIQYSLHHFKKGNLSKFDALVGETSCQIRAVQVIELHQELLKTGSGLETDLSQMMRDSLDLEKRLKDLIDDFRNREINNKRSPKSAYPVGFADFFNGVNPPHLKMNLDFIDQSPKLKYLVKLAVLELIREKKTRPFKTNVTLLNSAIKMILEDRELVPTSLSWEFNCQNPAGDSENGGGEISWMPLMEIQDHLKLPRKTATALVDEFKSDVAKISAQYMNHLDDLYTPLGQKKMVKDNNIQCFRSKICCVPFFHGFQLLMKRAHAKGIPILLSIFSKDDLDQSQGRILYMPIAGDKDKPSYRPVDKLPLNYKSGVFIIDGKTSTRVHDDYVASLKSKDLVTDVINPNVAAHPQFPEGQPFQDQEICHLAERAQKEGHVRENPFGFCIFHVYPDKVDSNNQPVSVNALKPLPLLKREAPDQ